MGGMKDTLCGLYRSGDPDTSKLAAFRASYKITEIQGRVLECIKNSTNGATDYDIQQYFEDDRSTYRTRRAELVAMGRVRDSGARLLQAGSKRIIWEYVT